jgi:prophage antirepressor-like protein
MEYQVNKNALITEDVLSKAMDYQTYFELTKKLVSDGKTTGPNQSAFMVEYTKLNFQRMKRHEKTFEVRESLKEKLKAIESRQTWVVISEPWCGDAAQNLPQLAKMALETDKIDLKIILRDDHLDIMDAYLTNGGRSIPKLIVLNSGGLEIGTWGPRPAVLQHQIADFKKNPEMSQELIIESVHRWYAENKSQVLQDELENLIQMWIG